MFRIIALAAIASALIWGIGYAVISDATMLGYPKIETTVIMSQTEHAIIIDMMGDRDGVAELHDGMPESSADWDCRVMGNGYCGL